MTFTIGVGTLKWLSFGGGFLCGVLFLAMVLAIRFLLTAIVPPKW